MEYELFEVNGRQIQYRKSDGHWLVLRAFYSAGRRLQVWVPRKKLATKCGSHLLKFDDGTSKLWSHVIAYLKYERWPEPTEVVDHINGDRQDMSWDNLRIVSKGGNSFNTHPQEGSWRGDKWAQGLRGITVNENLNGFSFRVIPPKASGLKAKTFKNFELATKYRDEGLKLAEEAYYNAEA